MNKNYITPPSSERYGALDGLRAYAAIGIVLMHVLSNIGIKPSVNYLTETLIPWFTDFTLMFMVVSGFSLCCGYYERVKTGAITPNAFYKKRYMRILPFFACLCLIDLVMSPSIDQVFNLFANLTLCFNFIPNVKIPMIGVGWVLGLVFVFYLLFPFFVFLNSITNIYCFQHLYYLMQKIIFCQLLSLPINCILTFYSDNLIQKYWTEVLKFPQFFL